MYGMVWGVGPVRTSKLPFSASAGALQVLYTSCYSIRHVKPPCLSRVERQKCANVKHNEPI